MGGGAERAGPGPTPPALAELSSEAVDVCIRELKHKNPLHHNFVQNTIFLRKQMLGYKSPRKSKQALHMCLIRVLKMYHGVRKLQKKYHSTLRAKRTTFTF